MNIPCLNHTISPYLLSILFSRPIDNLILLFIDNKLSISSKLLFFSSATKEIEAVLLIAELPSILILPPVVICPSISLIGISLLSRTVILTNTLLLRSLSNFNKKDLSLRKSFSENSLSIIITNLLYPNKLVFKSGMNLYFLYFSIEASSISVAVAEKL